MLVSSVSEGERVARRAQKRLKHIARVEAHVASCESERQAGRPLPPNPFDHSISKRKWELAMRQWSAVLACHCAGEEGAERPCIASAELSTSE